MTLTELARLAHVSTSTASKAFSMSDEVNDETRSMIFDVAKKHGCFKKFYRQEYPKCVIAVICPEFESSYYSNLLAIMKKCLEDEGAEMCAAESGFGARPIDEIITYYDKFNTVDGIILFSNPLSESVRHEIPIASFGHNMISADICIVSHIDTALERAIDHVRGEGIERIGFVGDNHTVARKNRIAACLDKIGISMESEDVAISSERFERGGYLGMMELLSKETYPRAVFCGYDRMAIGAMRAVFEKGLSVPDDIAVIGFDNDPQSEYIMPSLSTIGSSDYELCRAAAREITRKIRGDKYSRIVDIESVFVPRESTAKAKKCK